MKSHLPKQPRGFGPYKNPRTGVSITENIALAEIQNGSATERIAKIIEFLISGINDKYEGKSGNVSFNLSAIFIQDSATKKPEDLEQINDEDVVPGMEEALKKHLEKKARFSVELPQKVRKLKETKAKVANLISSNGAQSSTNAEVINNTSSSPQKTHKRKHSKSESEIFKRKSGDFPQTLGSVEVQETQVNKKKNKQHADTSLNTSLEKTLDFKNNQLNASLKSSKKKKKHQKLIFQESDDYLPLSV